MVAHPHWTAARTRHADRRDFQLPQASGYEIVHVEGALTLPTASGGDDDAAGGAVGNTRAAMLGALGTCPI